MSTLKEIVYNLRGIIRDNMSDDIKISDRQLEFMVNYVRAKLIRDDYGKGRSISSNITQDLGILELEKVDRAEDRDIKVDSYILRTKNTIPSPIEVNQKDLIVYVGGADKYTPIQIVSKSYSRHIRNSKYIGNKEIAYLKNGRIYIEGCNKLLKYINTEGVFEDPRQVAKFTNEDGSSCYDENSSYPMSAHMIQTLNELILGKELNIMLRMTEDTKNDASDETYGRQ